MNICVQVFVESCFVSLGLAGPYVSLMFSCLRNCQFSKVAIPVYTPNSNVWSSSCSTFLSALGIVNTVDTEEQGFELQGSTYVWIFFNCIYYCSTILSAIGWIHRWGPWRVNSKLHTGFQLCRGLVSLTPALFKGQLYVEF